MEQMSVSSPKRLFSQFLSAQVSFPPPDASSEAASSVIHRQFCYPETPGATPDEDRLATANLLKFCLPVTDPWQRGASTAAHTAQSSSPSQGGSAPSSPLLGSSSWVHLKSASGNLLLPAGENYVVHDVVLTDETGVKRYGTCLAVKGVALVEATLVDRLQKGVGPPPSAPFLTNQPLFSNLSQLAMSFTGSREALLTDLNKLHESHFAQCVVHNREALTACFVLLSPFPAYSVTRHCLYELMLILEEEKEKPSGAAERFVWWLMNQVIVPPNGTVGATFALQRSQVKIPFGPFLQPRVPFLEISLLPVFQHLGLGNIITIVAQLILEQPVIFFSNSYPLLTTFTEAFVSLLYPFQWRHVYLPVVPSHLSELLEAPGQYIYGALARDVEEKWNDIQPETLKVDLDRDVVSGGCDLRFQMPNSPWLLDTLRSLFYPTSKGRKHGFLEKPRAFQKAALEKDQKLERTSSFSTVLMQEKVDPELENRLNEEIRQTFILYYYDNLLKNFLDYRNQQDFNTVDFISSFPNKNRKFLEQFTASTIFNHFLETHQSTETTDDFDYFSSSLIFPREAPEPQTHTIDYGVAGKLDSNVPNFSSLKKVPEVNNHRIFRTDYFDLLKHQNRTPLANIIKTLEGAEQAVKNSPQKVQIVKWMQAVAQHEAGNLDSSLKLYSEILTKNFVVPEVNLILEKAGSKRRTEISSNPKTPPGIVALIHERDGMKPSMVRLSSQIFSREQTSDEWTTVDHGETSYYRPTDRVVLNEADASVPQMADLSNNPLLLATEALKLIRNCYSLFAEANDDGEMVFKEKKFVDIVKLSVFKKFTNLTSQLSVVDIGHLTKIERICFFLNVRTCLALHAYAEYGFPSSLFKRINFSFQKIVYVIGGNMYSISEISYGILRASMSLPDEFGVSFLTTKLGANDPRYHFRNDQKMELLNFVMFEGNASFPYAIVFDATDLMGQMLAEAQAFCDRKITIDQKKKVVMIPRALVWHMADFGKSEKDILLYIFEHLRDTAVSKYLESLGQKPGSPLIKGVTIKTSDYQWDFSIIIPRNELNDDDD